MMLPKTRHSNEILCKVTLLEFEDFKTNKTLGYYYAVILPLLANALIDIGYYHMNEETTDTHLRQQFFNETQFDNQGNAMTYARSFQDATNKEVIMFVEKVIVYAAQHLNTIIPEPQEFNH